MAEKDNIKTTIKDISRDNMFKVPEYYFDNFAVLMADRIGKLEGAKNPKASYFRLHPRLAAIVLSSLVLLFTFGVYSLYHGSHKYQSVNEISQNMEYSIISDMDETELIGQLEMIEAKSAMPVDSLKKVRQEYSNQVIDYLSKDDIDINTIEDAL